MIKLKLESWSALAPGMEDTDAWMKWFDDIDSKPSENTPIQIKQVPALLRRRFTTLGKIAAKATFNLMESKQGISTIFATRHGDTPLTLSLLKDIGNSEPLSPTSFSLAVHNAVGGLLSIARQDVAPITAIASTENLVLSTLHEAAAQLEVYGKVLCVIYDVPLPDIYQRFSQSLPFPVAVAFIVSHDETLDSAIEFAREPTFDSSFSSEQGLFDFISLLMSYQQEIKLTTAASCWRVRRLER
ncbi:beta-ketoacyl synthase chain length factor [Methylophaga sp.]|uniref:beta-ketoacyl synthase chain length factor n=2 Tax=Methylophaga TaxID=40222 RepID=UPI003A934BB2